MGKHHDKEAAAIAKAIEQAGIQGVHVDVDALEIAYLDGEVHNADDEAAAVQAAYKAGAVEIVDGLHYPDMPVVTHHIKAITSGIPADHHDKGGKGSH